jgi:hypothetical protein
MSTHVTVAESDAEALKRNHGGTWGEHREYPVAQWQNEVASHDTRLGYWDWVAVRLEQNAEERRR